MKLLHIDSGILGDNSVTRRLSAATVAEWKKRHRGLTVTYRDLAAHPFGHLTGSHLTAANVDAAERNPEIARDLAEGGKALAEFLAADVVVIGAPMYNFSIPSQLKAWIDRVAVAGKTFRYTEKGPQGLAGGKKVVIVSSRGGFYNADSGLAALDHQEAYLKTVLGFLGVTDVEFVRAEGVNISPEARRKAIDGAEQAIRGSEFARAA